MSELVRQEIMSNADLVVVKVGTRVLTNSDGMLDKNRIESIAGQVAQLWQAGKKCVLVSSGAVGAGLGRLGLKQRPTDLAQLQAAAAIGQSVLIESYNRALEPHQLHAAQMLLTAEDLKDRTRYLNVRNTLFALFESNAVPIINENDTVSVEELKLSFGDNDRLAALVTNLIRSPLLVLLSDIEGVFSGDPHDAASEVLSVITDLTAAQAELVRDDPRRPGMRLSTGGMTSKLIAARIATSAGENVVIANGHRENVLVDILAGKEVGTLFLAEGPAVDSRKRWIGWSASPNGRLLLDAGACQAISADGRSLLAVGVAEVEGNFVKGDVVSLCDEAGVEFARGLSNYPADEMRVIARQPSERIAELLGRRPYYEVVHRNNLIVLG
ncbi:Glutamate 5-kinase [Bythopirellula goksoeyrii]|uniref:Glutamate 5-kinase n=2 Tax=Bythopirellula goksoeyrii TaxID=1400387 RepID=A0A5B9Q1J1_9BACT|nr:Glutamate 5-kinase [Bythopirellula goksoeyrii]